MTELLPLRQPWITEVTEVIIILKNPVRKENEDRLVRFLEENGLSARRLEGQFQTVIGVIGDTT